MKVLLTGGAGFIGSNISRAYIDEGYEVVIVDDLSTGNEEHIYPEVTFYKMDVTDTNFLEVVAKENPDVINHHAAQIDVQTSIKNPVLDAKVNILGTINVLEACRLYDCKLVYASSAAIYGTPDYLGIDEDHKVDPISSYGISKHTPEHYIALYHELYNVDYTIFRYANAYGQHQIPKGEGGVISIMVDCAVKDALFTVFGDGEQTRDYIHIDDIVKANLIATRTSTNEIVNISTGIPTTLNESLEVFQKESGLKLTIEYKEERPGDIKHSYLKNEKAKDLLNWTPEVGLAEGLKKTYDFYSK
ncbi:NAD-dependent epimerase/dehydratase family protein [Rossellomorea aquimaris]|uniref:UDP-glucose 4-epimerase n=1 Tax=Rossellomorea aquimaris TaxID=189382 RepID=A0A366EKB1_9BACI|nr:NAD-dependent epimerase/dehydratase family protein [Rossellomorea aquimaris]RBP02774.1 UDP-glucose 4-epimerase [Rossellomorea aquimaris]